MAVMSTMLPFEIMVMFLDYFRTDKTELAKCTLIARNWIRPSRYHLFRKLTILQSPDVDGLAAFRLFLESARGYSAEYTRKFCLRGVPPEDETYWEPTIDLYELGFVVHHLPCLAVVDLDRVRFQGLPSDGPAPLVSEFVEHVNLARITTWVFDDVKDGTDILHLFPGLKTILTDDLGRQVKETGREFALPPSSGHMPFSPKLRLETITLKAFGPCSTFLDYAVQALNLCNVTELTILHLLPSEVASLGRFLVAVKQSLRYLHVSLSDCLIPEDDRETPEEIWERLRLSECEVLETLVMFVPLDYDPDKPGPSIIYHPVWLSAELILAQLPSSIQYLDLAVDRIDDSRVPWFREVFRDVQWADIARSLARLPKLKRLKMYRESRWSDGWAAVVDSWTRKYVLRKLSDLKEKGMLDLTLDEASS